MTDVPSWDECVAQGMTAAEAAAARGLTANCAHRWARKHGRAFANSRPRWSDEELAALRAGLAAGQLHADIAADLGRSVQAVGFKAQELRLVTQAVSVKPDAAVMWAARRGLTVSDTRVVLGRCSDWVRRRAGSEAFVCGFHLPKGERARAARLAAALRASLAEGEAVPEPFARFAEIVAAHDAARAPWLEAAE